MSFGEYVRREVAMAWFKTSPSHVRRKKWGELESENKSELRPILASWGHGRREHSDVDYWVDKLFHDIEHRGVEKIVIDDIRYPNEMLSVIEAGGKIIRLYADDSLLVERGATEESLAHPSENSLTHLTLPEIANEDRCFTIPAEYDMRTMWPTLLKILTDGEEE